jgi:hypothetical protein
VWGTEIWGHSKPGRRSRFPLSGVSIDWLSTQKPGLYGGLEVPLHQPLPAEVEAHRWD